MIIGPKSSIHGVSTFISGLQKSCRGVLRFVAERGDGMSTAWLITDSLAVAPDFAALSREASQFYVIVDEQNERIPVKVLEHRFTGSDVQMRGSPVLLRLARTVQDGALSLDMQEVATGEQVLLLQYIAARPDLQVSLGKLTSRENGRLKYDADTEPGSSGAPVFREGDWKVIGMHASFERSLNLNEGWALPEMLDVLRLSDAWFEIAYHHKLANVTAAQAMLESAMPDASQDTEVELKSLLPAVVQWSFPVRDGSLANLLRPLVVAPEMPLWILQPEERKRLVREAGNLKELQDAHAALKERANTPRQRVLDRILKGPPYDLDGEPESDLPYWLQAVRWFEAVIPELPTALEVDQNLERRRVRSRLEMVAGPGFRGRKQELKKLRDWQENPSSGPMVVTGIGGVGKSALISQFALNQENRAVLLWLDFDRADLAPDDAVSVLNLLDQQMGLQISGHKPQEVLAEKWQARAQELAQVLSQQPTVLLVLDGFEMAQHVRQHQEIWTLLNIVLESAPRLRIIVSGRAPVPGLMLGQRHAESLPLRGMEEADAIDWLEDHGITDAQVLKHVVEISKGVPLILKLALYLIQEKGSEALQDLPSHLETAMVEGFLYQRVLDRVIDPVLRPVAKDALALRRVTQPVMQAVIADRLPSGLSVGEVFSRLQQELSLVDSQTGYSSITVGHTVDVLHLRPEVRRATLHLLECDDPERVQVINRRAAEWYAGQDLADPAQAAELIYHQLRLGDLAGAEKAWRDDCIPFLDIEDLSESETQQRQWLNEKLQSASADQNLIPWERESLERIHYALRRDHLRVLPEILAERTQRSPNSPLVFYDVWSKWKHLSSSEKRLVSVPLLESLNLEDDLNLDIRIPRTVLGALLHREARDFAGADALLIRASAADFWHKRPNGVMEALAVMAARVRLTVDLNAEMAVIRWLNGRGPEEDDSLLPITAADILLPELVRQFDSRRSAESASSSLLIPRNHNERRAFSKRLERAYQFNMTGVQWEDLGPGSGGAIALRLRSLAEHRWRLAASTMFLGRICEHAVNEDRKDNLSLAVIATLAAFRGMNLGYEARGGYHRNLDSVLGQAVQRILKQPVPHFRRQVVESIQNIIQLTPALAPREWFASLALEERDLRQVNWEFLVKGLRDPLLLALILYLFSADPLETLCDQLANASDERGGAVFNA